MVCGYVGILVYVYREGRNDAELLLKTNGMSRRLRDRRRKQVG